MSTVLIIAQRTTMSDLEGSQNLPRRHSWCVIDLESTGFAGGAPIDSPYHRIVQIAACKMTDDDGDATGEFVTLVNPGVWIPSASTAIHRVTNENVANAPSFAEAWAALLDFIGDDCDGLVAHNMHGFDARLLRAELARAGLDPHKELDGRFRVGDSLPALRSHYPGLAMSSPAAAPYSLAHIHYHVTGAMFAGAHDALGDVRALRRVLRATKVKPVCTKAPYADDDAPLTALRYMGSLRGERLSDFLRREQWTQPASKTVAGVRAYAARNGDNALERVLRDECNVFDDGQCTSLLRQILRNPLAALQRPYFRYRRVRLTEQERALLIVAGLNTCGQVRDYFRYACREDIAMFREFLHLRCGFSLARSNIAELRGD